jgi:3'-phosphoadenosine 5'-phosphosulfate sulfotransferase
MARDDWRIRIELPDEDAGGFLDRLGLDLGSKARELAKELEAERLAVSRDDDTIFVYGSSRLQMEQARKVVEAELAEADIQPLVVRIEHWLAAEERWDDEPKDETWEEDVLERGYSPWEVRVESASHEGADALADRLEEQGYDVVRRWTYVIVGTATREEADALAKQLHGEVEAGGEVVYEAMPRNPFAIFGGLGG